MFEADVLQGWQRAEILGALVNGVFLIALCVSIFLEAIQRFVEPQNISNPLLIVIVGSAGLASNIIGLFLFHDHGHGHGHGHSHGETEGADAQTNGDLESVLPSSQVRAAVAAGEHASHSHAHGKARRHSHSHSMSSEDIYVHPAQNRALIKEMATGRRTSESSEQSPLLQDHSQHNHAKPKDASTSASSHGHDHGNMNMRAVFLHVLGDALGNVGVIATGLFVYLTKFSWRFYSDPVISLVITVIILTSAIPLCKSASLILLQVAPPGIIVDDIKEDIKSIEGVHSVHELHVWQLSDTKLVASVHVRIENDQARYMQIATELKKCLHAYGIHSCTIQPEFMKGLTTLNEGDECLLDCDPDCPPNGSTTNEHNGHSHAGHSH